MDTTGCPSLFPAPFNLKREHRTSVTQTTGPPAAPDFKKARSFLRTIQQREALGAFIRARWSPAELAELARQANLVPGRTYSTAASYRHAIEKGADHPSAVETLASLRNHHPTTKYD
ncbi:hypothetical protein M2175_004206 [Bradyrhizobium elkanii]|uniref:hypothetical protein n=1 Tax=Bradyrhizobium TaxID=374 RepID=UPI0005779A69|nr:MULTISPECIES: hypothetical protein [Bradyrhizobium]MCS3929175.1 hypothetical protein [Bradyrhizobium elkanii]MCS3969731.1 hypothetical protein [Bradyrhizobium japonicum]